MAMKRTPRPRDPIALAKLIGDIATGQVPDAVDDGKGRGVAGGVKGGIRRAEVLSSEQKSEIAKRAAKARWKKA